MPFVGSIRNGRRTEVVEGIFDESVQTNDVVPATILLGTLTADGQSLGLGLFVKGSSSDGASNRWQNINGIVAERTGGAIVTPGPMIFNGSAQDGAAAGWTVNPFLVVGDDVFLELAGNAGEVVNWRVQGSVVI